MPKTLDEAIDVAFTATFRAWWADETKRLRNVLNTHRDQVEGFLRSSIDDAEINKSFAGKVLSRERESFDAVTSIRPTLEPTNADRLEFSCDLNVSFTAIPERPIFTIGMLIGESSSGQAQPTRQESETRQVMVELAGDVRPDYEDLHLIDARPPRGPRA